LWHDFAADVGVAVDRNAAYLNWRLRRRPANDYRHLALYDAGKLAGFVSFCLREKHGAKLGYILELLYARGTTRAGSALLNAALGELASGGAELSLAWNLPHSANRAAYVRSGFMPLPQSLRPIELHWGVRRLAADAEAVLGNRSQWYLSYLDSDTV
jgi:hypothetical protein